jgi:hypothetical protein
METYNGYILMKQYSSGSKSDGYIAYLYISPTKVYKLYRAEVLPIQDTYFHEYHLKFVSVSGIMHQRIRSINVESIEIVQDPFMSNSDTEIEEPESID